MTLLHFMSFTSCIASFFMTFISYSPHTTGPAVRAAACLCPSCHIQTISLPIKVLIPLHHKPPYCSTCYLPWRIFYNFLFIMPIIHWCFGILGFTLPMAQSIILGNSSLVENSFSSLDSQLLELLPSNSLSFTLPQPPSARSFSTRP